MTWVDDIREGPLGRWGPTALLLGVSVALYARVLGFGTVEGFDDFLYLSRRPEVVAWFEASWRQRLLTPQLGYPVPLPTFLYYWIWQLPEGARLASFHGLNLGFHLVSVWAAWWLARRWIDARAVAWTAVLLWATHPLLVETIAWMTNLKGAMLAAAVLVSLVAWERHLEAPSVGWAAAALVAALVAFGCRPEAVVIAPLWAGFVWVRAPDRWHEPKVWAPILVVALVVAVYLPLAVWGQFDLTAQNNARAAIDIGPGERMRRIFVALGLQTRHILWPADLAPIYDHRAGWAGVDFWLGLAVAPMLIGAAAASIWRRGSSAPGWLVWGAFYAPASGIVFLPRFTADTYMYLPLLGLLVALGAGLERRIGGRDTDGSPEVRKRIAVGVGLLLAASASVVTLQQIERWRNVETLMDPMTRGDSIEARAAGVLVDHHARQGDWQAARAVAERSLQGRNVTGGITVDWLKAFAKTGDLARALQLGRAMLAEDYPGVVPDGVPAYLVSVIAAQGRAPGALGFDRPRFRRALRRAHPYHRGRAATDELADLATYLAEHGFPEFAQRYAVSVLRRAPERCRMWRLLDRLEGASGPEELLRPSVCAG